MKRTAPVAARTWEGPIVRLRSKEPSRSYIYGLRDPDTHEVVYVGQTVNLKARLAGHCHRRNARWQGFVIERVSRRKADEAESKWIVAFLRAGAPLQNQKLSLPRGVNLSDLMVRDAR